MTSARDPIPKSPPTFRAHALCRVIHLELDRMRGVLEANHFRHLEIDVTVDEIVVEHAARLQEGAVGVEARECLAQRPTDGWNLLQFRRRQGVTILAAAGAR